MLSVCAQLSQLATGLRVAGVLGLGLFVFAIWSPIPRAHAQVASASGSVGAGVEDGQGVATVAANVDLGDPGLGLGLGALVRFSGGSVREEDWDDESDYGRILRYLVANRELTETVSGSLAAGRLSRVRLGSGSIVRDYMGGLDLDRSRLGIDVRIRGADYHGRAFLDDVFNPQLAGLRVAAGLTPLLRIGAVVVADRATDLEMDERTAHASVDASLRLGGDRWTASPRVELVKRVGGGLGAHAGLEVTISRGDDEDFGLGVELRHGQDTYVPSMVGPLHIRDREQSSDQMADSGLSLAERAELGGLDGIGVRGELRATRNGLGTVAVDVTTRPGLPMLSTVYVSAPSVRDVQFGVWTVLEGDQISSLSGEARVPLEGRWFGTVGVARLYSRESLDVGDQSQASLVGVWLATLSLGVQFGTASSE